MPHDPLYTTTEKPSDRHILYLSLSKLVHHLTWRHHGIGVLQAYLRESTSGDSETRVHIWHPDLILPSMDGIRRIHDHRFDLVSTVLVGELMQEEVFVASEEGTNIMEFSVLHARAGTETPQPVSGKTVRIDSQRYVIHEGDTYKFPKRRYHRTTVFDLAVTVCVKLNITSDQPAQVLSKANEPPIHGFEKSWPQERFQQYIDRASSELLRRGIS